jgi:hypothetical protein
MRREFQAYTVKLINGTDKVRQMLIDVGFNVEFYRFTTVFHGV